MAILTTGNTFANNDQVTSTKLNNIVNAATWDDPADDVTIEVNGSNKLQVKTIQTGNIAASAVTTAKIADATTTTDGVTDAKLRYSAGLSVVGRGSNTTGAVADITAGSDYHVLRRSGTSIGFGQITPSSLTEWITSGTAQTASGTAVNFTSIPSWVKRITIIFNGVSLDGTGNTLVQLGDSGGLETTGYTGYTFHNVFGGTTLSTGFQLDGRAAANALYGTAFLHLVTGTTWAFSFSGINSVPSTIICSGFKALSGTLDRLSLVTSAGNFDAGTINIIYE
jgi:hypothetical protein